MTNGEIEAIADRLRTLVEYFCQAVEMETGAKAEAMDDIYALCAAARQPEILVGRRVHGKNWPENSHGVISDGPLYRIEVPIGDSMCRTPTLRRDDFELLEDDDAE